MYKVKQFQQNTETCVTCRKNQTTIVEIDYLSKKQPICKKHLYLCLECVQNAYDAKTELGACYICNHGNVQVIELHCAIRQTNYIRLWTQIGICSVCIKKIYKVANRISVSEKIAYPTREICS